MAVEGAPSLRETLEQSFSAIEAETPVLTESDVQAGQVEQKTELQQTPADNRARDERGRFAPGSPEANASAEATPKDRPSIPKSWKHDLHQHWDKLDPQVAAYIAQREDEAAAGIGKHQGEAARLKGEYERVAPLSKAIEPFLPDLQRHGIAPEQFITNLGTAHKVLALGSPQDKLAMFAQLAQQYQVPLGGLFIQDQNGQIQLNQQLLASRPVQQVQHTPDIRKIVSDAMLENQTAQEIAAFEAQKEKYPHYEKVKADMALIIQQGRAADLPNAYRLAIRLQDDLWQEEQTRQREHSEAEKRLAQDKAAKEAKAKALSPRSSTPSATLATGNSGKKDIRSLLSEGYDSLAGGRV